MTRGGWRSIACGAVFVMSVSGQLVRCTIAGADRLPFPRLETARLIVGSPDRNRSIEFRASDAGASLGFSSDGRAEPLRLEVNETRWLPDSFVVLEVTQGGASMATAFIHRELRLSASEGAFGAMLTSQGEHEIASLETGLMPQLGALAIADGTVRVRFNMSLAAGLSAFTDGAGLDASADGEDESWSMRHDWRDGEAWWRGRGSESALLFCDEGRACPIRLSSGAEGEVFLYDMSRQERR